MGPALLKYPQRQSLVQQTLVILRQSLAERRWQTWLPPERELSAALRISRPTLRAALHQIAADGLIRAEHGQGYRILPTAVSRSRPPAERIVHLLSPDPIGKLRLQSALWIEDLQDRIRKMEGQVILHYGGQFEQARPDAALEQLVSRHPPGTWVLAHSTRATQRWFADRPIPCVIAGLRHEGIALPFVTIDMHALVRHAVMMLARCGHRRIAYFALDTQRAGDLLAEDGFHRGIQELRARGVEGRVLHPSAADNAAICRCLERVVASRWQPTALVIATVELYATVATHLPRIGRRVPEDISLIARERDALLTHFVPLPCTYAFSPAVFAGKVAQLLTRLWTQGRLENPPGIKLLCDYVAGQSVAKPPAP